VSKEIALPLAEYGCFKQRSMLRNCTHVPTTSGNADVQIATVPDVRDLWGSQGSNEETRWIPEGAVIKQASKCFSWVIYRIEFKAESGGLMNQIICRCGSSGSVFEFAPYEKARAGRKEYQSLEFADLNSNRWVIVNSHSASLGRNWTVSFLDESNFSPEGFDYGDSLLALPGTYEFSGSDAKAGTVYEIFIQGEAYAHADGLKNTMFANAFSCDLDNQKDTAWEFGENTEPGELPGIMRLELTALDQSAEIFREQYHMSAGMRGAFENRVLATAKYRNEGPSSDRFLFDWNDGFQAFSMFNRAITDDEDAEDAFIISDSAWRELREKTRENLRQNKRAISEAAENLKVQQGSIFSASEILTGSAGLAVIIGAAISSTWTFGASLIIVAVYLAVTIVWSMIWGKSDVRRAADLVGDYKEEDRNAFYAAVGILRHLCSGRTYFLMDTPNGSPLLSETDEPSENEISMALFDYALETLIKFHETYPDAQMRVGFKLKEGSTTGWDYSEYHALTPFFEGGTVAVGLGAGETWYGNDYRRAQTWVTYNGFLHYANMYFMNRPRRLNAAMTAHVMRYATAQRNNMDKYLLQRDRRNSRSPWTHASGLGLLRDGLQAARAVIADDSRASTRDMIEDGTRQGFLDDIDAMDLAISDFEKDYYGSGMAVMAANWEINAMSGLLSNILLSEYMTWLSSSRAIIERLDETLALIHSSLYAFALRLYQYKSDSHILGIESFSSLLAAIATGSKFYYSDPGTTSINPVNFYSAEYSNAAPVSFWRLANRMVLLTENTVEFWDITNDFEDPLSPAYSSNVYSIKALPASAARFDDALYFIGKPVEAYTYGIYSLKKNGEIAKISYPQLEAWISRNLTADSDWNVLEDQDLAVSVMTYSNIPFLMWHLKGSMSFENGELRKTDYLENLCYNLTFNSFFLNDGMYFLVDNKWWLYDGNAVGALDLFHKDGYSIPCKIVTTNTNFDGKEVCVKSFEVDMDMEDDKRDPRENILANPKDERGFELDVKRERFMQFKFNRVSKMPWSSLRKARIQPMRGSRNIIFKVFGIGLGTDFQAEIEWSGFMRINNLRVEAE